MAKAAPKRGGTIEVTKAKAEKGTVEAAGKFQEAKGFQTVMDSFNIRLDPITFLGNPDPSRKSIAGNGIVSVFGTWDGVLSGVPSGRWRIVVEITFESTTNAKDKRTSTATKNITVPATKITAP